MTHTTTTHDPSGGGRPRLLFALGDRPAGLPPVADADATVGRTFLLPKETTRIGSHPSNELCLAGLAPFHAEIRRTDGDDYVLVSFAPIGATLVHGRPVQAAELHSGTRVELGAWVMSYARSEYADHGRPNGGRQGGELSAGPRVGA